MGGGREGTDVYLWLIHDDVWQKSTQYCNYLIKNKLKKRKRWLQIKEITVSPI